MNLIARELTFSRQGDGGFTLRVANGSEEPGETYAISKVVRVFPQSRPQEFVSFLDAFGHEVGLLNDLEGMDPESRELIDGLLREQYFEPTIYRIQSVEREGSGSRWRVETDEGEADFKIPSRDALDGKAPPGIVITPTEGRRYKIPDYWAMDHESRDQIIDMLPDRILRYRMARPRVATPARKR